MKLAMNLNKLIFDFKHAKLMLVSYDFYINCIEGKLSKDLS